MLTCTPPIGIPPGSVTVMAMPARDTGAGAAAAGRRGAAAGWGAAAGAGGAVCATDAVATNVAKLNHIIVRIAELCLFNRAAIP
jgi:hypothetical protein